MTSKDILYHAKHITSKIFDKWSILVPKKRLDLRNPTGKAYFSQIIMFFNLKQKKIWKIFFFLFINFENPMYNWSEIYTSEITGKTLKTIEMHFFNLNNNIFPHIIKSSHFRMN